MSTMVKHYAWPFVGLLILTTLALGTSLLSLGNVEIPIGIAIAIGKTLLVAFFFMHLLEHRTSSALAVTVALILLALLIGLSMLDVVTRVAPGPVLKTLGGPS